MPWSDAASAKYWMTMTCKRAGLRYVNFHQLRHNYASLAIMNGMSLDLVARALGHADTAMVQKHYGHLRDDYVARETRRTLPTFGIEVGRKVTSIR
jgi:integrase